MKARVLADRSTRKATENRAIGGPVSGHCPGNIHVIGDANLFKFAENATENVAPIA